MANKLGITVLLVLAAAWGISVVWVVFALTGIRVFSRALLGFLVVGVYILIALWIAKWRSQSKQAIFAGLSFRVVFSTVTVGILLLWAFSTFAFSIQAVSPTLEFNLLAGVATTVVQIVIAPVITLLLIGVLWLCRRLRVPPRLQPICALAPIVLVGLLGMSLAVLRSTPSERFKRIVGFDPPGSVSKIQIDESQGIGKYSCKIKCRMTESDFEALRINILRHQYDVPPNCTYAAGMFYFVLSMD